MVPDPKVVERLLRAWRGEIQARFVYEILASREQDQRRADILRRIAEAEAGHRRRLEERLTQLGAAVPDEASVHISTRVRPQAPPGADEPVPPATGASARFVLTAGLAGAIASALSMGVGAWLAARSTTEIAEANIEQERREITEHPEEEKEELSLFYQLKGLTHEEADDLVDKLARNPEAMLQTIVAEEFGGMERGGNPWTAAFAGFLRTGGGAMIPVIALFFLGGLT